MSIASRNCTQEERLSPFLRRLPQNIAVGEQDIYWISHMDERINLHGEVAVFSFLDAVSAYWKVEIETEDRGNRLLHQPPDFIASCRCQLDCGLLQELSTER